MKRIGGVGEAADAEDAEARLRLVHHALMREVE